MQQKIRANSIFVLITILFSVSSLSAQSRSIFDLVISGDLRPINYNHGDEEYLLSQVILENFDHQPLTSGDYNYLDQLAFAIQYSRLGDFQQADRHWNLITASASNVDFPAYIFIKLEFAAHLVRKNLLTEADSIYQKLEGRLALNQLLSPYQRAFFFEQRGFLRYLQSDLSTAQHYFFRADSLWEKYPTEFHFWRINYWNHLGLLQAAKGEYEMAENSYAEALRQAATRESSTQIPIADINSNLGNLSRLLGDYDQALHYFEKAKMIYVEKKLAIETATVLNNLALTYDESDSLDQAVALYEEALQIYEHNLGTNNIAYATILNNLAGLLDYLEAYPEAESKYLRCIEVFSSILGKENTYYTTLLNNLALLYESMARPGRADALYREAIKIRKKILGDRHPKYVDLLYNYAGLCSYIDPNKSLEIYREANARQLDLIKYYYAAFDEETRLNYLDEIKPEFEKFYATAVLNLSPAIAKEIVDFNLATKGLATRFSIDNRRRIQQSDVETQSYFKEWQILRDSLAQVIVLSESERIKRQIVMESLIHEVDDLEKRWTRGIDPEERAVASYESLKRILDRDEIAIDFIRFEWHEDGKWRDTIWYYALIIDPLKDYPEIIKLDCEQAFQQALLYGHYAQLSSIHQQELSKMILKPITPFFRDKRKVLLSPTGFLHKMPLFGLHLDDEFLPDRYEMEIYADFSKTKGFSKLVKQQGKSALLVGGLDYNGGREFSTIATFSSMDGSNDEILNITKALRKRAWNTTKMQRSQASHVQVLRELQSDKYNLLHFATHAYVFKQVYNDAMGDASLRNRIVTSSNPLLRTGLALSGANKYWHSDPDLSESGILSAYDIAQLELHKTELVVLSACESGIGDVHPEEGVFGLPRAFKLAGVGKVIYTLWKIDDQTSAEFLSAFYKYFAKSGNVEKAFRKTQMKMKRKYAPFFWAGFMLIN